MKGWALASRFYKATPGTKQGRLDQFHAALVAMGNAHAARFEDPCCVTTHF